MSSPLILPPKEGIVGTIYFLLVGHSAKWFCIFHLILNNCVTTFGSLSFFILKWGCFYMHTHLIGLLGNEALAGGEAAHSVLPVPTHAELVAILHIPGPH